jgi:hypothetical protein
MAGTVVKVIIGLFIWMMLPRLIYNKRKYQKNTPQFFVNLSCKIVGISIIFFSILNFIKTLLEFNN